MKCSPAACCSTDLSSQWQSNTGHYRGQEPTRSKLQSSFRMPKIQRICQSFLTIEHTTTVSCHSDAKWLFFSYSIISLILKVLLCFKKVELSWIKATEKNSNSLDRLRARGLKKKKKNKQTTNQPKSQKT